MQKISVRIATATERPIIEAFLPTYLRELNPYDPPEDRRRADLAYPWTDAYWESPGRIPLLVRLADEPVGFVLVRAPDPGEVTDWDWQIAEFYIAPDYRGRGIGAYAADQALQIRHGRWEICYQVANTSAARFWRDTVHRHAPGATPLPRDGAMMRFLFEPTRAEASQSDFRIRSAREDDLAALPEIERAAAEQLKTFPANLAQSPECFAKTNPVETFRASMITRDLWVAVDPSDQPIGFALTMEIDGTAHLEEIDVHPDCQKQGIGRALLHHVMQRASERGHSVLTLSTFSTVPWNQPFYEKMGFAVVPANEWSAGYHRIRENERASGLNLDVRVIMRRSLKPA